MPNWKASFKSKLLSDEYVVVKRHTTLPDYYYWQDTVDFLVGSVFVIGFVALLGYILWTSSKTNSNCARIPIFHPAGDYNRRVCVEPK